jgi:hypothetical protein
LKQFSVSMFRSVLPDSFLYLLSYPHRTAATVASLVIHWVFSVGSSRTCEIARAIGLGRTKLSVSHCKLQARPLVRVDAIHKETENCQTKRNLNLVMGPKIKVKLRASWRLE